MNDGEVNESAFSFGPWWPLDDEHVRSQAPDVPGAVQLRRADGSLVRYPRGRSAMVFYFYAARSTREALRRLFRDELEDAGSRGEGPLAFRVCPGGDHVRAMLERLYGRFGEDFGRAPILHPDDEDEDEDER